MLVLQRSTAFFDQNYLDQRNWQANKQRSQKNLSYKEKHIILAKANQSSDDLKLGVFINNETNLVQPLSYTSLQIQQDMQLAFTLRARLTQISQKIITSLENIQLNC